MSFHLLQDIDLTWSAMLFGSAILAGFVDTLAGGGGLITVPVLLLSGMSPLNALGTNKLQGTFGTLVASIRLIAKSELTIRDIVLPFFMALMGGIFGSVCVQFINVKYLDFIVPFVLIATAIYFLLAPNAGEVEGSPRLSDRTYSILVLSLIGFYDGFFGPGAGSFYALSGVALRGWELIRATANAKVFNFASSLASLAVFICSDNLLWSIGLLMIGGQLLGSNLGALAVVRGGAKAIRPMIVGVCIIMIVRYFSQKGII